MRQLSSSATFIWKFLFPLLWIAGFGVATVVLFTTSNGASRPEIIWARWTFLVVFILGTALVFWAVARVKKVGIRGNSLVISNFRTEITVPMKYVSHFKGSLLLSPELVWIYFKRRTDFGNSVVFMPPFRVRTGFTRPPMVAELNAMLDEQPSAGGS